MCVLHGPDSPMEQPSRKPCGRDLPIGIPSAIACTYNICSIAHATNGGMPSSAGACFVDLKILWMMADGTLAQCYDAV